MTTEADNQLASDPDPAAAAAANPDPGAADPQPDPGAAPAGEGSEPETPPEPAGDGRRTPWYMHRIAEGTARYQEEARARQQAEERAHNAEELAQRLQRGEQAPTGGAQPQPVPREPAPTQDQFNTAVRREAQAQRFYEDTTAVKSAGLEAFGAAFNEKLNILTAVGATADDFVLDVLAVDKPNAHVILHKLAEDPERAAALAQMDSRRRTAELVRMNMTDQPKPAAGAAPAGGATARAVSKVPPPKPTMQPVAANTAKDWDSDDSSPDDFMRGWKKRYLQQA